MPYICWWQAAKANRNRRRSMSEVGIAHVRATTGDIVEMDENVLDAVHPPVD